MKRIIDGKTYNTDSSTVVAEGTWNDTERQGLTTVTTVYLNRAGIYFAVRQSEQRWRARDGEIRDRTWSDWEVVGDEEAAAKFCEDNALTIYHGFDAVPEAGDTSETETIYVRVPRVLKLAVEAQAKAEAVSINLFAMRCLERCIRPTVS